MNKKFYQFWLSQAMSTLGDVFYQVIIMVHIFERTSSPFQTGLVVLCNVLPGFLISPKAGHIIDKFPRVAILQISNMSSFLALGALSLFMSGSLSNGLVPLWILYLTVSILSMITAFLQPAKMALIPSLVPPSLLAKANSFVIASWQGIMGVGFGAGGLLATQFDLVNLTFYNAAFFLLGFLLLFGLNLTESSNETSEELPFVRQITQTNELLKSYPMPRKLIIIEFIEHVPHGVWNSAVTMSFVLVDIESNMNIWGYMGALYFAGMLLGAILSSFFNEFVSKNIGKLIVINGVLTVLNTSLFGLSPNETFLLIIGFVFGIPNSVRDIAQDTLIQARLPSEMMGRVYAYKNMFTMIIYMIAGFVFSALIEVVSARWIYWGGAVFYLMTTWMAWKTPGLLAARVDRESA